MSQSTEQPILPRANAAAPTSGKRIYSWLAQFRGAVELGWYDFVTQFRRSFFGPLWVAFQLVLWIGSLTVIFHDSLGNGLGDYALYVGVGLFTWNIIAWPMQEGPRFIINQSSLLKNVPVELSYLTVRKLSSLVFRTAFQIPVPVFLVAVFGSDISWNILLLAPAIALFVFYTYACLIIFGVLGAYLRDFEFFMPTVTRFLFFASPVFWQGDAGFRKVIADYNPFAYFLELIRAPLAGNYASVQAWIVVSIVSMGSFVVGLYIQREFRKRVIYFL